MNCPLMVCLEFASTSGLLAQLTRRVEIVEPWLSPELLTTTAWILFAFWMFAIGASVGSFLNVVVYRMPAGMSLSVPGSRCPRCQSPIRLRHNIPILGWLILRGRCADCQLPISSRYPLVELLIGLLFLLIGGLELMGNGLNLPKVATGPLRPALTTSEPVPLGVATTMHCVLAATLVGAALIDHDGPAVPLRMTLPLIAFAVVASLGWPQVHPIPANEDFYWPFVHVIDQPAGGWRAGFTDATAAAVAGLIAALCASVGFSARPPLLARYASELLLLWVGIALVFGWQMIPWLFASWGVAYLLDSYSAPGKSSWPVVSLAAVCIGSLIGWRWLADYAQMLGDDAQLQVLSMASLLAIGVACLCLAARFLPATPVFTSGTSPYCQPVLSDVTPEDEAEAEEATDSSPTSDDPKPP